MYLIICDLMIVNFSYIVDAMHVERGVPIADP